MDPRPRESPVFPEVIAGLGNPGPRYERTRHNAGFLVLERLRREASGSWRRAPDREECRVVLEGSERLLVRPLSFMNRSGVPLSAALAAAGLAPGDLLVVVDDIALPVGRLRLRRLGGAGGHNGLVSICESLGTESFARLRVGVGPAPPEVDLSDFVLDPLAGEDWERFAAQVDRAADAVRWVCREGLAAAMNRFNPTPAGEDARS